MTLFWSYMWEQVGWFWGGQGGICPHLILKYSFFVCFCTHLFLFIFCQPPPPLGIRSKFCPSWKKLKWRPWVGYETNQTVSLLKYVQTAMASYTKSPVSKIRPHFLRHCILPVVADILCVSPILPVPGQRVVQMLPSIGAKPPSLNFTLYLIIIIFTYQLNVA